MLCLQLVIWLDHNRDPLYDSPHHLFRLFVLWGPGYWFWDCCDSLSGIWPDWTHASGILNHWNKDMIGHVQQRIQSNKHQLISIEQCLGFYADCLIKRSTAQRWASLTAIFSQPSADQWPLHPARTGGHGLHLISGGEPSRCGWLDLPNVLADQQNSHTSHLHHMEEGQLGIPELKAGGATSDTSFDPCICKSMKFSFRLFLGCIYL